MNMIFNKRCDSNRWDYGAYQGFGDNVIRCHHERGVLCGRGEDRLGRDCAVYMQRPAPPVNGKETIRVWPVN